MGSDRLKPGFTTGAAAAAAAKAAIISLFDQKPPEKVDISSLNGELLSIPVNSIKSINQHEAEALIIKDAGDDPDVTHKAEIGARVSIPAALSLNTNGRLKVIITGGEGVGTVTKPGLEIKPGNPAINPGPQKMILEAVESALEKCGIRIPYALSAECRTRSDDHLSGEYPADIEMTSTRRTDTKQPHTSLTDIRPVDTKSADTIPADVVSVDTGSADMKSEDAGSKENLIEVEVFVPKGIELAEKTLNGRLGIVGGISILGTTGIVRPMSHDAYIATIRSGISVAMATGSSTLVFTTGRRSERVAMDLFPDIHEESFIQTGDFFKASLEAASEHSFKQPPELETTAESGLKSGDIPGSGTGSEPGVEPESGAVYRSKKEAEDATEKLKLIIVVFFGKAVKMAMGFPHTHAAKSELTMKKLTRWSEEITGDNSLSDKVSASNTARHAFSYIYPQYPELVEHVGMKIIESAEKFSKNRVDIRSIILDFDGKKIFDSGSTKKVL